MKIQLTLMFEKSLSKLLLSLIKPPLNKTKRNGDNKAISRVRCSYGVVVGCSYWLKQKNMSTFHRNRGLDLKRLFRITWD